MATFIAIMEAIAMVLIILFLRIKYSRLAKELTDEAERLIELKRTTPTMDIGSRIAATTELMHMIDLLIDYEIITQQQYDLFVKTKNPIGDFDKLVEKISTNVFNSINKNLFDDRNNVMTDNAIMQYITRRTVIMTLKYIQTKTEEG